MKCDEKRDVCGPCERSGRECVYVYKDGGEASATQPVTVVALPSAQQTEVRTDIILPKMPVLRPQAWILRRCEEAMDLDSSRRRMLCCWQPWLE